MAVPGSGEISLGKIAKEFVYDNYDSTSTQPTSVSLQTLSTHTADGGIDAVNLESPSFPDGNAAHAMSEFFAYDHDYSPIPCNKAMDVVFLLDYTFSMTNYYNDTTNGLKAQVATISNKIVSRSEGDYRLAMVLIDHDGILAGTGPYYTYWDSTYNTAASNLASQYRYTQTNSDYSSSKRIYLTGLVPFASANKSDFDSKMSMLFSASSVTNQSSTAMVGGTGSGGPEPNDTAIDRVINHNFVGAFRSGVNKMIILVTDNAMDGDGDDQFNGEEEYLKMGTLSNDAVAENISISIIGEGLNGNPINNVTANGYSSDDIYQAYADNTGGDFNNQNDSTGIITQIDNICNDIETNFPTVVTNVESSITTSGFTMNGNVTNQGGSTVTTRGFVRNTSNTSLFIGGSGVTNTTSGSGTGTFSSTVTGLSSGTTYYYRAYATNSTGTSYGDIETVVTSSGPSLTSFSASINSNFFNVCSESITATYYHDGSFSYPDVGDTVYSNSSGSSYLSSGYYKLGSGDFMNVGSSGSVTSVDPCGGP